MDGIAARKIVIDLDDTISRTVDGKYGESVPVASVVDALRRYRNEGYRIVILSSRNMRTYSGNIGEITIHTVPTILEFLKKYDIPCDELVMGKPWCGRGGFYVDDRTVRPSEFVGKTEREINDLLDAEKKLV